MQLGKDEGLNSAATTALQLPNNDDSTQAQLVLDPQ